MKALLDDQVRRKFIDQVGVRRGNQDSLPGFTSHLLKVHGDNLGCRTVEDSAEFICNPNIGVLLEKFCQAEAIPLTIGEFSRRADVEIGVRDPSHRQEGRRLSHVFTELVDDRLVNVVSNTGDVGNLQAFRTHDLFEFPQENGLTRTGLTVDVNNIALVNLDIEIVEDNEFLVIKADTMTC